MRCRDCKFWRLDVDEYNTVIFPYDPTPPYEQDTDEDRVSKKWGHRLRRCENPKLRFFERPSKDGATLCDGSEYYAALITAEEFGCVNGESIRK